MRRNPISSEQRAAMMTITNETDYRTFYSLANDSYLAVSRDTAQLITTEFEPSKAARPRENFDAGGLADLIELREGDALETLAHDLPDPIDLVLLDGAKRFPVTGGRLSGCTPRR